MGLGDPGLQVSGHPGGVETRADLARELTALRARSGLTIRALADRLDIPFATVGGYFSGRHLPGPAQLDSFCALLRACGVSEGALAAWLEALARVRLASDGRVGRAEAPYRGLEPFAMQDMEMFFGREAATQELLERLRALRGRLRDGGGGGPPGMLLLLGPSGSGKSSLLQAGVAAHVAAGALDVGARDGGAQDGGAQDEGAQANGAPAAGAATAAWSVTVITPGAAPADTLGEALSARDAGPRLIVIDRFEEVFAASEQQRRACLEQLERAWGPELLFVAGMRSDFYEAAVHEPLLLPVLRTGQLVLGPMTEEEVRGAIVEPAHRAGVVVEESLVDVLLADLAPGSPRGYAHAAGALPLLSYALLETWQRAHRNQLTIAEYRAAGGLRGAVSQRAEELYGQLAPERQELARRIFCRLVRIGDDEPLTRRRVDRRELAQLDGAEAAAVLDRFVDARLVTLDEDAVELSHEALLSAWPRLARWLERDRSGLRLQHQLADAAGAWDRAGRDPGLLLRGIRLQAAVEWAREGGRRGELNPLERELVEASVAFARAERDATRRRARTMQRLLAATATLALAAVVLAVLALHARHDTSIARDQALSRQVAIEADGLEATDPALAMQLALAAYRIHPTIQATSTLLDASAMEMPTRLLGAIGPTAVAVSRTGGELAVAHSATDSVALYAITGARPRRLAAIVAGSRSVALYALALSPDGRLLAAGGTNGMVTLWSLAAPRRPRLLATLVGSAGTVYGLAFNPSATMLAAVGSDGTVRRWSLADPAHPLAQAVLTVAGHPYLQAVSYSPDGARLAVAGANGSLYEWSAGAHDAAPLATRRLSSSPLTTVAYSPDGGTLAVGSQDYHVYLLHAGAAGTLQVAHRPLGGFTSWVDSLAFSADGRYLAAGDSDSSLRVWSTSGWRPVARLMHPAQVTGAAFTSGDRQLVTADEDGTTRLWSFPPPGNAHEPGNVYTIDYTANGDELAAVSGGPGGDVGLWSVADPWRALPLASVRMPASFGPVAGVEALSPDGRLLAVGNAQAKVQLVDLSTPRHPRLVGGPLSGATPVIEQLNFSPDMKLLSVGDNSGRIHLWGIADPAHPLALEPLDPHGTAGYIFGVAYAPDGKLLAAAASDHKVWLWNIANPRHAKLLAVLGGFRSDAYTVAFSTDGRTLIAGGEDDTVRLWDVSDAAHPRALGHALTGPTSTIYQVAVSPDGHTLAAATTGGQVWLWKISDPAHPVQTAVLTAEAGQIFDVTFSPNDHTLVASGADATLHFWDYRPAQVAARVCALAGSPITHAEWAQYVQGAAYDPPCR